MTHSGLPLADWSDALPPAGCTWPAPATLGAADEPADTVKIYCLGLEQPADVVARLATLLSDDERERAARLRGADLRRRFLVSHGVLRVLLGTHAQADPRALRFDSSGEIHGKPRLTHSDSGRTPAFNLSHSGEIALVAVAERVEIGVDVEQVEPMDDLWGVAEIVYTQLELHDLRSHSTDRQLEEFYRIWTRKEAALKAVGRGFGIDPRLLEMLPPHFIPTTTSDEFARAARGATWCVSELQPAPGYAGALVALDASMRTRIERWPR